MKASVPVSSGAVRAMRLSAFNESLPKKTTNLPTTIPETPRPKRLQRPRQQGMLRLAAGAPARHPLRLPRRVVREPSGCPISKQLSRGYVMTTFFARQVRAVPRPAAPLLQARRVRHVRLGPQAQRVNDQNADPRLAVHLTRRRPRPSRESIEKWM